MISYEIYQHFRHVTMYRFLSIIFFKKMTLLLKYYWRKKSGTKFFQNKSYKHFKNSSLKQQKQLYDFT